MEKNIEPISEKKDMHTGDVASPSLKENSSQLESTRDLIMGAANTNEGRGLGSGLFGSAKVTPSCFFWLVLFSIHAGLSKTYLLFIRFLRLFGSLRNQAVV